MKSIDTNYLDKCITKLEEWCCELKQLSTTDKLYEVYRSSIMSEFAVIIDQSQKLLGKKLLERNYLTHKEKNDFVYKDFFRYDANFCESGYANEVEHKKNLLKIAKEYNKT